MSQADQAETGTAPSAMNPSASPSVVEYGHIGTLTQGGAFSGADATTMMMAGDGMIMWL